MNNIILGGLAAGALAVLLCTSSLGAGLRNWVGRLHDRVDQFVNCCFCATWWISIAMLENFTVIEWAATVAVANFTVLIIHLSMGSVEDEEPSEIQQSMLRELRGSTQGSGSGPPLRRNGDR